MVSNRLIRQHYPYLSPHGACCNALLFSLRSFAEPFSWTRLLDGVGYKNVEFISFNAWTHHITLGATALGEPWPPQQSASISPYLASSPSTALSSLPSGLLPHRPSISNEVFLFFFPGINIVLTFQVAIAKPDFQTPFINVCFSSFRGWLLGFETLFLRCGVVSPTPTPQPGGPGYPFSSGSSPLTCLAWEALPVAYAIASIALGFIWPVPPPPYFGGDRPRGFQEVTVPRFRDNGTGLW